MKLLTLCWKQDVDIQTNKQPEGDVVATTTEEGYIVCVTRQDEEGRVLSIIAEGKPPKEKEDTELIKDLLYLVKRFSHCDESGDYYMESDSVG